jgi:hypothetical protein
MIAPIQTVESQDQRYRIALELIREVALDLGNGGFWAAMIAERALGDVEPAERTENN